MGGYALLICRSQTEAIGLRRHLARLGVPGEVARPPRQSGGWNFAAKAGSRPCARALSAITWSSAGFFTRLIGLDYPTMIAGRGIFGAFFL